MAAGDNRTVTFALKLDASGMKSGASEGVAAIKQVGDAAAAAGKTASDGLDKATESVNAFGESQEQAAGRIKAMVAASVAAADATRNLGENSKTLAERSGLSADAAAALNKQLDLSAASAGRVRERADALSASQGRLAQQAVAATRSTKDEGDELNKLLGRINPAVAKLGELDAMQSQLAKAKSKGLIDDEGFADYTAKINASRAALTGAGEAASHLSFNSAAAKREIGVLAAEMSRGDFTKFQGSLLTLANRTGLLATAFSPLGVAIGIVAAIMAVVIGTFVSGEREAAAFNKALIATGNYAGQSVGSLRDQASAIGAATGEYGEATEAITKLAASGKLSGSAFELAANGAVSLAAVTGESVSKAVDELDKLAKDPLDGVEKLNEQYHFLTGAIYDQIKALQDEGDTQGATTLAVKTLADTMESRRQAMVDSAGIVEKAWRGVKDAIGGAIDNLKQVGRTDLQGQLASAYTDQFDIAERKKSLSAGGVTGFLANFDPTYADKLAKEEAANSALIKSLQDRAAAQQKVDDDARKQHALADAEVEAQKAIDASSLALDKQAQKAKAIQELNNRFTALFNGPNAGDNPRLADVQKTDTGFSGGEYDKQLAEINEKYGDHGKAARDAAKADREAAAAAAQLAAADKSLNDMLLTLGGGMSATDKAQADFQKGMGDLQQKAYALAIAGGDITDILAKWQKGEDLLRDNLAHTNDEIAKRNKLQTGNDALAAQLGAQRDKLMGLTAAQVAYDRGVVQANKDAQDSIDKGRSQQDVADGLATRLQQLADIRDNAPVISLVEQFGSKSEFDQLLENLDKVKAKLADTWNPAELLVLNRTLDATRQKIVVNIVDSAQTGLRSLQSMTKDGSKAFQAFQVAIDALSVAQAISAVLNQGQGDPYTAFARMAAMAAAVAALGVDIGGFGGGGGPSSDSAEVRQKVQGTGSVLGDTAAQSESIAKAIDITANATTQLVGLNRGMLTALQALQNALGAAGNQLARGAGDAQFAGASDGFNIGDPFGKDPLGGAIGNLLFGGKQKVIDQGIVIAGGALNDMLNQVMVGAYETIKTSGGLFGGGGTDDQLVDISDEFGKQFQLVIKSIADTVRQGALALGLLPADIDAAMAKFQVEEQRISLQGLSAEDQQKALEAVFSKLFDGLAGAIVPFIGQFQQVGEGLGETLVRVATEVQVSQEAFKRLGITVNETDPEKFAQIADGLVQAAGGLDAFISSMQSFVDKFAPDSAKFQYETDALNSGLSQVGLTLPTTRDGMYALMNSLDATTEAGRAQIATLLRLTDTSDAYYNDLEKRATSLASYGDFIGDLANQSGKLSAFATARLQIEQWERDTVKQANALAKAAGLQGASEQDLTLIHQVAAKEISDAIAELQSSTQDLVDKLYHNGQSIGDSANGGTAALHGFGSAITSVAESASAAVQLLLGDLSPLNDNQKLQYALQKFDQGMVSKQDVLTIGQRLYGSSQQYVDLFNSLANRRDNNVGGAAGGGSGSLAGSAQSAQQSAAQRTADAQTIAQNVASLANAQHESFQQVADSLHLSLKDLAKDLGLSGADLDKYLQNSVDMENAIPDSLDGNFNRLIAALYDIAGLPAPVQPISNTDPRSRDGVVPNVPGDSDTSNLVFLPHGHSGHAMPTYATPGQTAGAAIANGPSVQLLADVRDRLDQILAVAREGNEDIVREVRNVVTETSDLGRSLERGVVESAAGRPRSGR